MKEMNTIMKTVLGLLLSLLHFVFLPIFAQNETAEILEFRVKWDSPTRGSNTVARKLTSQNNGKPILQSFVPLDFVVNSCELGKYNPPKEFLKHLPYYLSGFDEDGRPIWCCELGKYDLRRFTSGDANGSLESFDAYIQHVAYIMMKSAFLKPTTDGPLPLSFVFIIDFEGFSAQQLTIPNLRHLFKMTTLYYQILDEYTHQIIFLNTNYFAELWLKSLKPVLGRVMEKIEIFGTNRAKFFPYMRRTFKDQIPPFYGGSSKNFTPIRVYG